MDVGDRVKKMMHHCPTHHLGFHEKGNSQFANEYKDRVQFIFDDIEIADHSKLLSIADAKEQCTFMRSSIEMIVARQQRKCIPTIINGVHIIPEVLAGIANNKNVMYAYLA